MLDHKCQACWIFMMWDQEGSDGIASSKIIALTPNTRGVFGQIINASKPQIRSYHSYCQVGKSSLWCVLFTSEIRMKSHSSWQCSSFNLKNKMDVYIVAVSNVSPNLHRTLLYALVCTWMHKNNIHTGCTIMSAQLFHDTENRVSG